MTGQSRDRRGPEWRSHVFGIGIRASFQAPGLPSGSGAASLPVTRLELVDERQIDEEWQPDSTERLLEETIGGSEPARTIDFHPEFGHRLYARHFGLALITPNGDRVLCAPPGETDWSWQRFLVGRILPWTALVRGREVFHASAVQIGGRAIAIVAPSGGGKTSLALRLVLRGAGFITDDVLALERTGDSIAAHPGANITAVRPAEKARLDTSDWRRLGKVLGHSVKTYVEVERESKALPLAAIYFVTSKSDEIAEIEPGVDARELLGSTFISSVVSPQRLTRLLELCGEISSSVALLRLPIDPDAGAGPAADRVWEHASATVGS